MKSQNTNAGKFIFAGGGTGGHLYPAIALAQEIKQRHPDSEIHFIGTARGIENRIVPPMGYQLHLIAVRGVQRGRLVSNLLVSVHLGFSIFQCLKLLLQIRPSVVIGTGGYVSGPMVFIAALLGIPTLVQEQNSYPGITTRLLARLVNEVHLSYEISKKYFKRKQNLWVSGNPVRNLEPSNITTKDARLLFGLDPDRFTVLVFGGSQGARGLNNAVAGMVPQLLAHKPIQLIWSAGVHGLELAQKFSKDFPGHCAVSEFIHNMTAAYAASDLVICRAGATTLSEITLLGMATILVPFPYAAAGHQEVNAKTLAELGAAEVILESTLTATGLMERVLFYFNNSQARIALGQKAAEQAKPEATKVICDAILSFVPEPTKNFS